MDDGSNCWIRTDWCSEKNQKFQLFRKCIVLGLSLDVLLSYKVSQDCTHSYRSTRMYIYTCSQKYIHEHTHSQVSMIIYMHTFTQEYMCAHTCTQERTYAHRSTHMYIYTEVHAHTQGYMHIYLQRSI